MQKQEEGQKYFTLIYQHPEWDKTIKPELQDLAAKKIGPRNMISYLQKFLFYSETHMERKTRRQTVNNSFNGLLALYNKEIVEIIGDAAQIILNYETNRPKFPIFYSQKQLQHDFKKSEILLLMCMMSLSLIPNQECRFKGRFCWNKEFSYIFSQEKYKTLTIVEYLKKQINEYKFRQNEHNQQQILTIRRNVETKTLEEVLNKNQKETMCQIKVTHDADSIENYYGDIKADFANKFIGGGSLTGGCVQEEIMFANHPELYVSMLFSEMMYDNQSIFFNGFKKYFKNNGYARTTSYDGFEKVKYQYDQKNRAKEYITAIDAIHFPSISSRYEFSKQTIDRELFKAYVGFNNKEGQRVVTGNWGCGAFNGNIPLKLLIQWIACSLARKNMIYAPFGFQDKLNIHKNLFMAANNIKIKDLYNAMIMAANNIAPKENIINNVQKLLNIQ